jgi:hypothetical protein
MKKADCMKHRIAIPVVCITAMLSILNGTSLAKQPNDNGFLTAQGTKLYLDGKEYREISVNKFDLFFQIVVKDDTPCKDMPEVQIENCLADLNKHGFRMIRVACSPFYYWGFEKHYFDSDPNVQAAKRKIYFERFDRMLDMCDKHNITIVCSLVWNQDNLGDLGRHSLGEAFTNPDSLGRKRVREYMGDVVSRYKDRRTVAMWELGNEWNLGADLQRETGLTPAASDKSLVRDKQNNYTSEDLANTVRQMAVFIKSIDKNHLITAGYSSPRQCAMHLFKAVKEGRKLDETLDTKRQLEEYLAYIHPAPIDVIQIHYYEDAMWALGKGRGDVSNIKVYKELSDKIGKPLIIGEIGLYQQMDPQVKDYRNPKPSTISYIQNCLDAMVENKIPITLYWTYCDDQQRGEDNWSLRYGVTDQVLAMIERANREIKK